MRNNNSKRLARLLTVTLLLAMLVIAVIPVATYAAESQVATVAEDEATRVTTTPGATGNIPYFKADTYYDVSKSLDTPLTYEFEVSNCGNIGSDSGGIVIGNYGKDKTPCVSIELSSWGQIRFYVNNKGGYVSDIKFSGVDHRKNDITHYAITIDPNTKTAKLYVNGVLKSTVENSNLTNLPTAEDFIYNLRIGGDHRSGNGRYFKGNIHSVALYSDVRTDAEIAADSSRNKTWSSSTDNLMAAYDITRMGEAALRDYSGNGNVLTYTCGSGIQVQNFGKYEIDNQFGSEIETYEAWVCLPATYDGKHIGGTIFGNYRSYSGARAMLEIYQYGNPRFSYTNANGTTSYHRFTDVDLRTGSWTHLAIVHDVANGEVRCYVNGVLKQTLTDNVAEYSPDILKQKFLIGRDTTLRYAEGNGEYWDDRKDHYFKGFIKEVRVFSDVRTAEEIASDYAGGLDTTDTDLLACYQLSQQNAYSNITDLSGNGHTAIYKQLLWEKEYVEPIKDNYSYSLALIGDTQTVTYQNPELLKNIYQWILDNQTSKNIQYVIGLGDITEYGVDVGHANYDEARANAEWTAAKEAISLMDGKIPYSLIRGDGHDGINLFNQYFAEHKGYTDNIAGYYQEGKIDNVYHTFTAGTVDYLLLCLDHGTKDDVLVWANEVVAAHPNHRVIVTTHHYMKSDGNLSVNGEAGNATAYDPSNNAADDLWNEFLTKHPNISMVICGHSDSDDVVVNKKIGDHGNEVTQILVDPQTMDAEYGQGSKGMVAMLYFSEDGTEVQVEYYSTIKDTYRPANGFTVDQGTHNYQAAVTEPTCTAGGYTTNTCSVCNDTFISNETTAKGHTEEKIPAVAPTCTETGLTEGKKCSVCDTVTVAQTEVAALGHNYQATVTEPTCTAGGYTTYTCSVCNHSYVANQTEAKGHTEEKIPAVAPTCTETGLTEGKKCSVCGVTTVEQTVVDALGHTETTIPAVAPTCTETGLTEGKKCSVCGTVTVAQTTVDALGHTEEKIPAVAPTCTETGLTEGKKCSVCGTVTVAQTTVDALGHTEETIPAVAPTCTETGLTEGKKCTVCGTVTVAQTTVDALGHVETVFPAKAPTCTETGLTEGKQCTVCLTVTVEQQVIDALGHDWQEGEEGHRTCSRCDVNEADTIPTEPGETVEKNHDECTASALERFINAILNFLRELFGLPKQCICGDKL